MNAKSLELQITVAAENAANIVTSLTKDFKDLKKSAGEFAGSSDNVKKTIETLEASAERTAKSLKLFGASSSELKGEQQKLKNGILDLVQHGMNPESEEVKKLVSRYKELGDESDRLEMKENGLFGVLDKLKGELGRVAVAAAAVKWDGMMISAGANALDVADRFKTARNEFGVLLGDMQAGAALFDDIIKPFNDFTPFDLETTTQATKIFLAAKVPIADLTNTLNRMGNIAQGNSQKMLSFANAFSKASAKGKADMEVLNVYLDQGVPILDALAEGFDTTTEEIIKMASKGEISFKDFQSALERLTAAGGAYAGGMELASRSYAAMWAGLHEALDSLAASIGELFLPEAVKVLEWLTNVANAINDSPLAKGVLVGAITAVTVALNLKMIVALVGFIAKTWSAFAAQMALNSALSVTNLAIAAATVAVGLAVAGIVTYAAKQKEAADATNAQALAMKEQEQATKAADQAAKDYLATIRELSTEQLTQNLNTMWSEGTIDFLEKLVESNKQAISTLYGKGLAGSTQYEMALATLAANEQKLADAQERRTEALKILTQRSQDSAVATSNDLLKWRDQKYSQTLEGQYEAAVAELNKAKSLRTAKVSEYDPQTGEYKATDGYNRAKTEAIIREAQKRVDDLYKQLHPEPEKEKTEPRPEFKSDWSSKVLEDTRSGIENLYAEWNEAQTTLVKNAIDSFGVEFDKEAKYIEENAALEFYYQGKIAEEQKRIENEQRQRTLSAHEERMKNILEEYEYQAALARENIYRDGLSGQEVGNYALNSALSAASDTQVFQVINGSNPILMAIDSVIGLVLELENVQKLLNPISTVLDGLLGYSEELLNDALQPIVDILMEIGETIGQILQPVIGVIATALRVLAGVIKIVMVPLNLLGNAFEWFYNKVIRPVGNAIIKMINFVISALNNIPFVNIKKLELLPLAGEKIGEVADAASKAADAARKRIEAMYRAQIDTINDELRYQLQSIQKQYELGLISRQQYIDQKNAYKAAADNEILKIEQQMAVALEHIEENTYAALDQQQQAAVANQREDARQTGASTSYAEKWGSVVPIIGGVAGAVVDVGVGIVNGIKTAATGFISGVKNFFGFAVGTDNIPYDMPAIVHKGEGVIPKTFNEAIKNGTYALVGKNSGHRRENSDARRSSTINVSVHVEGSVIKQKDLVAEIYNGLAAMIGSGEAAPLPA